MKKKVFLFACIEKNIGDDLFIRTVCDRYPHVQFTISSDANYGSLSKIKNLSFSRRLKWWTFFTSLEPRTTIRKITKTLGASTLKLLLGKRDVALFIVGNAFKNFAYRGKYQSEWIKKRLQLAKKFYLISTNFGPYNDNRWKDNFEEIFPQMADVCFRDEYSYQLFEHLSNTRFAPDAILTLGEQQVNGTAPKNVIISIIDCSFNARSEELRRAAESYESKMIEVAQKFLSEGYRVTLLNSNANQDRPACDRIISHIDSDNVDVVDYNGELDVVFDLYRNSSCVVATRLHTIILAWLYRLPVVPIVYDIKVENLLNSYHFSADRFDIKSLDDVSSEDIFEAMRKYDYFLSQETIDSSHLQFKKVDIEFSDFGKY